MKVELASKAKPGFPEISNRFWMPSKLLMSIAKPPSEVFPNDGWLADLNTRLCQVDRAKHSGGGLAAVKTSGESVSYGNPFLVARGLL